MLCCAVLSHVWLFGTPWTIACEAPLSMEILQERILEWGCHALIQGIFPTQGWNPGLPNCRWIFTRWGRPHNALVDAYNILIPYPVISQIRFQLAYRILKGSESSLVLHISACCSFPLTFNCWTWKYWAVSGEYPESSLTIKINPSSNPFR